MAAGLGALGLWAALRGAAESSPRLAESWAATVAPLAAGTAGLLPSLLPFSVAELLVFGTLVALPAGLVLVVRRERARHPTWRAGLAGIAVRAAATLGLVLLSFDVLWGLNYARPELAARAGWTTSASDPDQAGELHGLAAAMVDATNAAYVELAGSPDAGRPTPRPDLDALQEDLAGGFVRAGSLTGLQTRARGAAPVKPLGASVLFSHLGLAGFYFPWTAESNVNADVPGCSRPQVVAHEMAHRRGFASEDEAQFAGYLACVLSPSPAARYSGLLFAQRELLFQLLALDPAAAQRLIARRVPGVQRDVDDLRAFWSRYEGPAARASDAVNDAYLTVQGVPGGIESYRRGARLLVLCARAGHAPCRP